MATTCHCMEICHGNVSGSCSYYLGKTQMLEANHPELYRRFMISTFVNACSATLSQVSRRNMLSSAAVNSLGDMVSPCGTLLLVLILLLSSCRLTVIELLV